MKNRLICICGPTASGKTALSVALAKKLNTEIISADSMQLYKGMDIGTAKPTLEEQQGIKHHLFDVCMPNESFSVAKYVKQADHIAQYLLSHDMIPIVTGGTGLYMDALIEGNAFTENETDPAIRDKYAKLAQEKGNEAVHKCLEKIDPISAKNLHPNNLKRVIRALEVYEQTGLTIGEFNKMNKRAEPKYQALKIAICPQDREVLYERINQRVDQMINDGLINETLKLFSNENLSDTASQAIGYKELSGYLFRNEPLEDCIELLKRRSRNYAKRQLTWLKRDDRIHWIYYNKGEELQFILQETTEFLQKNGVQ